ncbi:aminotransferase class I/II-fold pyridoxal phosphate-dependent enzyme [Melittangium boletus]|uniref:Histidinol-phosphate transaminase n=1 Tax=Melittangium boletus DSM 14713 TaxID=1294270 RepID=A0A250IMJ0_9BACT|nr:aminotransferase class I/II-fold pyridoxal phosphate-dependent enzyme [Melittangium boletus]ATB32954.1 histidinol-phosphate transaminase [Melittangium boletus DSM 14713]
MRPLVPAHIETLKPYVPGKPIEETEREYGLTGVIKLASNENPLGPSPKAIEAMRAAAQKLHLYPDASSYALVRRLATHLGVRPEEVLLGCGSNELIEVLIRTFTTPEDEVLLCQGSFPAYRISVQAHGRPFAEVPMREGRRVRPMAGNGYPTSLRISVGTREENARCVTALREVLAS